jgi:hypothetical protein
MQVAAIIGVLRMCGQLNKSGFVRIRYHGWLGHESRIWRGHYPSPREPKRHG